MVLSVKATKEVAVAVAGAAPIVAVFDFLHQSLSTSPHFAYKRSTTIAARSERRVVGASRLKLGGGCHWRR